MTDQTEPTVWSTAVPYLYVMRYASSAVIAGGSGVTLAMLVTSATIHSQSYFALITLYIALADAVALGGGMALLKTNHPGRIRELSRKALLPFLVLLVTAVLWTPLVLYGLYSVFPGVYAPPYTTSWWVLVGVTLFFTLFGSFYRAWAEIMLSGRETVGAPLT
jgi:hypothetical protein